ncbi:hypothetical protein D8674_009357 [Pyrus ussuriensis x Pyrus communis]|uniref:Uncharacterized protein n=1 Tax=Pyrus ussuriensis x Pyrus communis TaxID=2448454 RepID=A0A5N5F7Q2_9ROSA|nr:hypothetical protein D8674_009357 [Pyrus ussuriensis x Pyrus communis]
MAKGGSLSESVIKRSSSPTPIVIVYNKYIIDKKMYNWPFPISLTMIHMSFYASIAFLLVGIFRLIKPSPCPATSTSPPSSPSTPSTPFPSGSPTPPSGCSRPLCLSFHHIRGHPPCLDPNPPHFQMHYPHPITSLYYVAPCCLVFLFAPWIFVEYPVLRDSSSFHFDFLIFRTNSIRAFALNLAVFLLVGKTSAWVGKGSEVAGKGKGSGL